MWVWELRSEKSYGCGWLGKTRARLHWILDHLWWPQVADGDREHGSRTRLGGKYGPLIIFRTPPPSLTAPRLTVALRPVHNITLIRPALNLLPFTFKTSALPQQEPDRQGSVSEDSCPGLSVIERSGDVFQLAVVTPGPGRNYSRHSTLRWEGSHLVSTAQDTAECLEPSFPILQYVRPQLCNNSQPSWFNTAARMKF